MAKILWCIFGLICITSSLPINEEVTTSNEDIPQEPTPVEITETLVPVTNSNGSQDIYVIKTIVYEVGILTEADNSTLNDTVTHEEVNLTFFDPKHNETTIDLSNIPIPIQTNVSGVEITGIAPVNFGSIQLAEEGKPATLTSNYPTPFLPNAVISVKHNISTTNADKEAELLQNLPTLLGLTSPITGEPLKVEPLESVKEKEEEKEVKEEKKESEEKDSSEESGESNESSEEKKV